METLIENFVQLAKEVAEYFKPIQSFGSKQHTDYISVYFSDKQTTVQVDFGDWKDGLTVSLFNERVTFNFSKGVNHYELLYKQVVSNFKDYKETKGLDRDNQIKQERENQIKALRDQLAELTK